MKAQDRIDESSVTVSECNVLRGRNARVFVIILAERDGDDRIDSRSKAAALQHKFEQLISQVPLLLLRQNVGGHELRHRSIGAMQAQDVLSRDPAQRFCTFDALRIDDPGDLPLDFQHELALGVRAQSGLQRFHRSPQTRRPAAFFEHFQRREVAHPGVTNSIVPALEVSKDRTVRRSGPGGADHRLNLGEESLPRRHDDKVLGLHDISIQQRFRGGRASPRSDAGRNITLFQE